MPIDGSIYGQFAQPYRSIDDVTAQAIQNQLAQNALAAAPLRNQLLQAQVSQAQIANQQNQLSFAATMPFLQRMAQKYGGTNALQGTLSQASPANALQGPPTPVQASPQGSASSPDGQIVAQGTNPDGSSQPVTRGMIASMDPDDLAMAIKTNFLPKEAIGLWQDIKFGRQLQPGYRQNADGSTSYLPDPGKGITIDPKTGHVTTLPGAVSALGAVQGAQANATEQARATYTPSTQQIKNPDGSISPMGGSVLQQLGLSAASPAGTGVPPALPSPLDSMPPDQRALVLQDMARTGLSPTSATLNGQPMIQPQHWDQMQGEVDAAKAGGPVAMAQLQAKYLPNILKIPDPTQQAATLGYFNNMLGSPANTPIKGASAPQLAGPADIAGATKQAEANVSATMDPLIALRKGILTDAHTANQKSVNDLADITNNEGEIVARNNRLQPLLTQIGNIGGFGQEERTDFANKLQQSGLISDALAQKISGGDPNAQKIVQNQLSAAAIQTMLDTLNKEGRPNKIMYQAIQQQQEGLDAGKPVLQGIMNLQQQLYDQHRQQLGTMTDLMSSPSYNPVTFQNQFATAKSQQIQPAAPVKQTKTIDFGSMK